jgi:predicted metalloprotease with PDZ domain
MVAALNAVQPYDWHGFLRSHLDDYGQGQSAGAIERSGYKLVFKDKPLGDDPPSKALDLAYSVGMRVNAAGRITAVRWDGPAFKAKLTSGETIVSVNGKPYDADVFTNAINQAVNGGPLESRRVATDHFN